MARKNRKTPTEILHELLDAHAAQNGPGVGEAVAELALCGWSDEVATIPEGQERRVLDILRMVAKQSFTEIECRLLVLALRALS